MRGEVIVAKPKRSVRSRFSLREKVVYYIGVGAGSVGWFLHCDLDEISCKSCVVSKDMCAF